MQVGDLIKIKEEWARRNPWVRGTLIDETPKTLGLIVSVRSCGSHNLYKIEWLDGRSSEVLGKKLEVA